MKWTQNCFYCLKLSIYFKITSIQRKIWLFYTTLASIDFLCPNFISWQPRYVLTWGCFQNFQNSQIWSTFGPNSSKLGKILLSANTQKRGLLALPGLDTWYTFSGTQNSNSYWMPSEGGPSIKAREGQRTPFLGVHS